MRSRAGWALRWTVAPALALAGACGQATELSNASTPAPIADRTLVIGDHRLHLPDGGDWVLVERSSRRVGGRKHAAGVELYLAWLANVQAGELRSLVFVALPGHDSPDIGRNVPDDCSAGRALRTDGGRSGNEIDCVAAFGERDFRATLQQRAPDASAWLADHRVRGLVDAVRIGYTHRAGNSFGRIEVHLPTSQFASDDEAGEWGNRLRAAIAPMFTDSSGEGTLPPLAAPTSPGTAAAPTREQAAAAFTACVDAQADGLDDAVTPAADIGTAVALRCRDDEARLAVLDADAARVAQMSEAERADLFAAAHRRHVEDGIFTAAVLQARARHRALAASAASR